jgi:hypothetical protein
MQNPLKNLHLFKTSFLIAGALIELGNACSTRSTAPLNKAVTLINKEIARRQAQMIGRKVSRDEVSKEVIDRVHTPTFYAHIALVDIIIDQITAIPLELLTIAKIRSIIEQEVYIWQKINNQ